MQISNERESNKVQFMKTNLHTKTNKPANKNYLKIKLKIPFKILKNKQKIYKVKIKFKMTLKLVKIILKRMGLAISTEESL